MNKEKIEREVQNVMNELERPYKYIGTIMVTDPEILIMSYESKGTPFSLRITDDAAEIAISIESEDHALISAIHEDIQNLQDYLNRLIYLC